MYGWSDKMRISRNLLTFVDFNAKTYPASKTWVLRREKKPNLNRLQNCTTFQHKYVPENIGDKKNVVKRKTQKVQILNVIHNACAI